MRYGRELTNDIRQALATQERGLVRQLVIVGGKKQKLNGSIDLRLWLLTWHTYEARKFLIQQFA